MILCLFAVIVTSYPVSLDNFLEALTFHQGEWAGARRTSSIPELQYGGSTQWMSDLVRTVQCQNMDFSGTDYQWCCETPLDSIIMNCEGYNYSGDEFVLNGSCGLKFPLIQTPIYVSPLVSESVWVHSSDIHGLCFGGFLLLILLIAFLMCIIG